MPTTDQFNSKIFIVDDDPMAAGLYEQTIRNLGYENIQVFADGLSSLNALTQEPDVVFLDHNMDNLNGLEVLHKIKRFDPNIYVVFVSGQETIDTAVDALKRGAFDYIKKDGRDLERIEAVLTKIHNVQDMLRQNKGGFLRKTLSLFL